MIDFDLFIKHNNLKKKDLASYLGVSSAFITQVFSGVRQMPEDKIALIKANNTWDLSMFEKSNNSENIAEKQDNSDIAPSKNTISIGKVIPYYDAETAAGVNYDVNMIPAKPMAMIEIGGLLKESEAAIRVYGNSMIPNYPAGCVIGTRLHMDNFIEPGRVYVIETRSGRYLKRLYYNSDKTGFECLSDNHMVYEEGPRKGKLYYPEFEIPFSDVVRIHKVVGVIKRNEI